MAETERFERGVNRRQLLKRGAIVGGLAWTAPIIVQSITTPAGAQTSPVDPDDERGDDERDERDPGTTSGSGIAPITEPVPPPPDAVSGQATFTG